MLKSSLLSLKKKSVGEQKLPQNWQTSNMENLEFLHPNIKPSMAVKCREKREETMLLTA
jgi:hypothetical protein